MKTEVTLVKDQNTDFETRSLDTICVNESHLEHSWVHNLKYSLMGILFGIILVKAEVISWFRIQEMFRLQSFHMYGIIGSAVAVGALSVWLIRKFNIKTIYGEEFGVGYFSDWDGPLQVHVPDLCLLLLVRVLL